MKNETDFASINYPISIILSGGDELVINSNQELEDALKNAMNDCDEDDDNDHNDDDADDTELVNVLLDGHWVIDNLSDGMDHNTVFAGYTFAFFENGRAKALKGDSFIEGKWDSNGDDGGLELELDFGPESPFNKLNHDWDVIEFDGKVIRLKYFSEENNLIEYLTLKRPEGDGIVPEEIINVMVEGSWMVALCSFADNDVTEIFQDYILTFSASGAVIATRGDEVVQSLWDIMKNDQNIHKLVFDFGTSHPLNEINNDWLIIEVNEGRIELKDVSGNDGSITKLVFERPETNSPSISTVIVEGSWIVANYNDSGTDETVVYNDMAFIFSANQSVHATKGNDVIEGTWSVMTNNDGVEKLLLNFGEVTPLDKFNNDWPIIDVKETRIELKDISGIDQSTDKLVFERVL